LQKPFRKRLSGSLEYVIPWLRLDGLGTTASRLIKQEPLEASKAIGLSEMKHGPDKYFL
jgi:hypothetical protein